MAIKIKTVGELLAALQRFAPETPVVATWEGVCRDVAVYRDMDGDCILDADRCFAEDSLSDGSM